MQKLYDFAVLYHPRATKEQKDAGDMPRSILLRRGELIATDDKEVAIKVAREIDEKYLDKLDQVEIILRPFA